MPSLVGSEMCIRDSFNGLYFHDINGGTGDSEFGKDK